MISVQLFHMKMNLVNYWKTYNRKEKFSLKTQTGISRQIIHKMLWCTKFIVWLYI